jgi:fucose 4-O-acetylase-like acetyltransferase
MDTTNNTYKSSETATPVSASPVESPRTERLPWVDAAKVVGIWLVVLGHIHFLSLEIVCFIYTFHMPLFFFLSGYLEKRGGIIETFRDSTRKLLVPYFLLNLICYLVLLSLLLTGLKNQLGYFWWLPDRFSWQECFVEPLTGILTAMRDRLSISSLISAQTWFLIVLFFVKITYSIINKRIVVGGILSIFIFPILVVLAKTTNWANYLYPLDSVFLAFPFFVLGSLAKERKWFPDSAASLKRRLILGVLGIIGLCLLGFLFRFNLPHSASNGNNFIRSDVFLCEYGRNIILYYLFGFLGIVSVLMFCQIYMAKFKIVKIISGGTILIFALEARLCKPIILKIFEKIIGLDVFNSIVCAGLVTTTILLFVIPIRLASKYFPILLGGRRG